MDIILARLAPEQTKHTMWFGKLCLKLPITKSLPKQYIYYYQDCKYLFSLGTDSKEIDKPFLFENTGLTLIQGKNSVRQAGTKCPIQVKFPFSKQRSHIPWLSSPRLEDESHSPSHSIHLKFHSRWLLASWTCSELQKPSLLHFLTAVFLPSLLLETFFLIFHSCSMHLSRPS